MLILQQLLASGGPLCYDDTAYATLIQPSYLLTYPMEQSLS